jgi:membrane associated rhomboid family serine protease
MRAVQAMNGSITVLGGRVPVVVALLMGLTLAGSILGANILPLLGAVVLSPALVGAGQLWRLVTWVFFDRDPISLIFALLCLFWFGRELVRAWGAVRFLCVYLGMAGATGLVTCLLAWLVWPGLAGLMIVSSWPLVDALIIAFAVVYPYQDVLMFLVLPLRGRNLIYCTVGGTLLFALLGGGISFVPHFLAQGLMMLYLRQPLLRWWLKFRLALLQRRGRRSSHLRPVDRSGRSEPPRWLH